MKRSVKLTSISTVMFELESYEICAGVKKLNSHTQNVKTQLIPVVQVMSLDIPFP